MIENSSRLRNVSLVPEVKTGKQKPPTPPKPVQYQPVNYKRLIDSKYPSSPSPLLQIVGHNYEESILDRSLTDETIPLIEEEVDRHTSPASKVKPPLLPKPQNIPPKLPEFEKHFAEKRNTNPFRQERRSTNPFESEKRTISGTNPFEFAGAANFEVVTENHCVDEFRIEHRLEVSKTSSLESSFFSQSRLSPDFSSLDDIHKQFNSDKECLIEKSYTSYSRVLKKHADHDKSNRSSWKSNSDLENGDEGRSRSSSINDNDYWIKNSPKSSSSGSPAVRIKIAKEDDEEKGEAIDEDAAENSENSYSVRRRIKTWFGSFGKGNKNSKRRDSTFYVNSEGENKNMWDTASVSSTEEKNEHTTDDGAADSTKTEEMVNGNVEPLTESERKQRKAYLVIQELISSEKVFINVLKLLTNDFVNFVKSVDCDNPVISDSDLNKIINTLPQLQCFNEDLLRDFEERLANWTEYPKIADIIIKKGPFLKLFSTYIQNFEKQCNCLDEFCQKYHRFSKAVKDFEALEQCKKLTLKHYMLKPVQRLPQYRLLLEDYLHQQYSESLDYDDTQEALKIVCEVAEHANRSVQREMHSSKLLQLQAQLGNHVIIKPSREFVKAGELYKYSRKEMHLRYFILLSDCLLYTRYYGSMFSLTVKHELPLAGMKVCVPKIEDYHNEFNLITTTRSFTLRARSPEERDSWVAILEKTIKEHTRKQLSFSPKLVQTGLAKPLEIGKQAPVWIPDNRVTMCQVCTAEFKVTFRRHHCRACGKVVCSNCSDNKAPLQYMNFKADRVCDACYEHLLKEYTESKDTILKNIAVQLDLSDVDAGLAYDNICAPFRKYYSHNSRKAVKNEGRLFEVPANLPDGHSGWLYRRKGKSWKKNWFVLKGCVLYMYRASEDVKALETFPVLGYVVETFKEASSSYEDIDSNLVFQLAHAGQPPVVFYADTEVAAEKWILALQKAVNIS